MNGFAILTLLLIAGKALTQLWLNAVNRRHVAANAGQVPEPFKDTVDAATYAKSVRYTLAKGRLGRMEILYDAVVLLVVLFSGVLPWTWQWFATGVGLSDWSMAAWIWTVGVALTLPSLPVEWYAQFHLEERFGFNKTTPKLWWMDRVKAVLIAAIIGYPLLVLILRLIHWTGDLWWLWAWAAVMAFQLLMLVLAPVLIMPLFNKFTSLPEGSLRDRLLELALRTGFRAQSIQVMDGSKRSTHSNAFFTGFGKFRKIVLFDTLIEQLKEEELEAVLAHEIGHYKKKHIPKLLAVSALSSLAGFYVLSILAEQPWFYGAFGFGMENRAPALLLFGLLGGLVMFWFSPLVNRWSRRFEYQADAFAAAAMNNPKPLVTGLRKLSEKNLSNLTPHPLYSGFYYSHPTLLEREAALLGKTA